MLFIPPLAYATAMNDYTLTKKVIITLDPENAQEIILRTVTGVGYIDKARIHIENSFVTKLAVLEVS
jgi:hypothetical protein